MVKSLFKLIKNIGFIFSALLMNGCYYFQQGWALVSTYGSGRPVEELLRNPDLPDETRKFLEETLSIRSFAVSQLRLKTNQNYTSFVSLDRNYLAAVVSACSETSFNQYKWSHPFIGSVPYQGYFDKEGAKSEAETLKSQGWDVWVRPVAAFSTLGWFQDPLFSFMKDYEPGEIADLLIHEQTHATIWIENQPDFNENLAMFTGQKGAELYLAFRYGPTSEELAEYKLSLQKNTEFRGLFKTLFNRLSSLYDSDTTDAEKLSGKTLLIQEWKNSLDEDFARWKEAEINNAILATYRNYDSRLDEVEEFFQACGSDLRLMLEKLNTMDRKEPDPWLWMKKAF